MCRSGWRLLLPWACHTRGPATSALHAGSPPPPHPTTTTTMHMCSTTLQNATASTRTNFNCCDHLSSTCDMPEDTSLWYLSLKVGVCCCSPPKPRPHLTKPPVQPEGLRLARLCQNTSSSTRSWQTAVGQSSNRPSMAVAQMAMTAAVQEPAVLLLLLLSPRTLDGSRCRASHLGGGRLWGATLWPTLAARAALQPPSQAQSTRLGGQQTGRPLTQHCRRLRPLQVHMNT